MYDWWATQDRIINKAHKYGTGSPYELYRDNYGPIIRDSDKLQQNCNHYLVVSDVNDPSVEPHHQQSLSQMLKCPILQ